MVITPKIKSSDFESEAGNDFILQNKLSTNEGFTITSHPSSKDQQFYEYSTH